METIIFSDNTTTITKDQNTYSLTSYFDTDTDIEAGDYLIDEISFQDGDRDLVGANGFSDLEVIGILKNRFQNNETALLWIDGLEKII